MTRSTIRTALGSWPARFMSDSTMPPPRTRASRHHATVRELYVGRLTHHELGRLARLFEKALPGIVAASVWPPPTIDTEP